jgi:hypothetical protein
MDRQAIDVHGRIPFSNAERNCALPKMGSKAPTAEGSVVARSGRSQIVDVGTCRKAAFELLSLSETQSG